MNDKEWTLHQLRAAKTQMEKDGYLAKGKLVQYDDFGATVSRCTIGALEYVKPGLMMDEFMGSFKYLSQVIVEQFHDRVPSWDVLSLESDVVKGSVIIEFNDHPDTTLEDVLLVFEKAIVNAEEALV